MSIASTPSVGQLILSSQRRAGPNDDLSLASLASLRPGAARLALAAGGGAGTSLGGGSDLKGLYGQLARKFLAARGGPGAESAATSSAVRPAGNASGTSASSGTNSASGDTLTLSAASTRTLAPTLRGGSSGPVNGSGSGSVNGGGSAGAGGAASNATPAATASPDPGANASPAAGASTSAIAAEPDQSSGDDDPSLDPKAEGPSEPAEPTGPTANQLAAELVQSQDVQDAQSLNSTRAVLAEVLASGGQVSRTARGRFEFVLGDMKGELRGDQASTRLDLTFTNALTGQSSSARVSIRNNTDVRVTSSNNATARVLAQNFVGRVMERATATGTGGVLGVVGNVVDLVV